MNDFTIFAKMHIKEEIKKERGIKNEKISFWSNS